MPFGNLHHHVVKRGLKASGSLAGDVVWDFVEGVVDRKLGGDFGNWEPRGLGSQGRGAGDAWVHLDHHHAPRTRVDSELDVRSSGLHADLADNGDRRVAHGLILTVSQSLRGRDGDGVARMHAHGIKILNRTDDDDVIFYVAHHLELEFLPAENRFLDQGFVHGREVETASQHVQQFFAIEGNAAASAAERKGGTHNDRKANFAGELEAVFQVVYQRGLGHIEADPLHRVFEEEAVFSLFDSGDIRAYKLHIVFVEHAVVGKLDGQVKRGLPANRRKDSETCAGRHLALNANDFFQVLAGERLNVRAMGHVGIGHDGGGVGVGQHHFVTLGLERLARLRARVVELGGLADDVGARAEDQDFRDVGATWHVLGNLVI